MLYEIVFREAKIDKALGIHRRPLLDEGRWYQYKLSKQGIRSLSSKALLAGMTDPATAAVPAGLLT